MTSGMRCPRSLPGLRAARQSRSARSSSTAPAKSPSARACCRWAFPLRSRSTLEIIRFAAANHLCVDLTYDGSVRRIEPYSLRQTAEGNFVLHAIRSDSGEHRSLIAWTGCRARPSLRKSSRRDAVELTSTGPLTVAPSTAMPRIPSMRRAARTRHQGPTYDLPMHRLRKDI